MNSRLAIFSISSLLVHRFPAAAVEAGSVSPSLPVEKSRQVANLEIRPAELQVLVDGRRAGLTVREFELFNLLAERPDTVVQRPDIYAQIWGDKMQRRDRSVDVLVRKVRRKLEQVAPEWRYIHTHFGVGYRFSPERVTGT